MSSLSSVNTPAGTLPPEDIHASFIALLGSMLGLLVTGIGMVWYWRDLLSTGSVACQGIGSLLLALAVSTHVGHLAKRIGRFAVVLTTFGLYLWAASYLPFLFDRRRYGISFWQHYFYFCWGVALELFALTTFIVLLRKEAREERDEEDPKTAIHISFTALLEHAAKHLGYAGVMFGIISGFIWALSALPFAIKPELLVNPTWGLALSNGLFALPYFLAAITLGSIALKKRSLEAQGASDKEFEGL